MRKIDSWVRDNWSIRSLFGFTLAITVLQVTSIYAQTPSASPTPTDKRGLGIEGAGTVASGQTNQQAREAKPELVLQTGYNSLFGATRMIFSPDGQLLATTTFHSSTIKLWEIATGRELRDLSTGSQSSPGLAPAIAFSRDSRLIAAAAGDNSAKIWEVKSGREVQTLAGPQGSFVSAFGIYFLSFAANGQIVTMSDAVRVWDVATGKELRTLDTSMLEMSGFNGTDSGITLTPDGTQLALATSSSKDQIRFLDLASGRETRSVDLPNKQIESLQLAFAPDGHLVFAGIVDKRLKLWHVNAKQIEQDLGPTLKEYSQIKFSRDGRLLSLSESYTVKLWDVATGRELPVLKVPNGGSFAEQGEAFVSFSEDGRRIATGGFDTQSIIWDSENGKQLSRLNGRTNMAYNVAFSSDGNQLSSGGRTRWDLRTGRGLRLMAGGADKLYGIPSPDGRYLAEMRPNSNVQSLFETASGRELATLKPGGSGVVEKTRFSNDGSMLVTTYGPAADSQPTGAGTTVPSNSVKIWEVKTGRELKSLAMAESPVDAAFSSDGHVVATIGTMGQLSLWDVASGSKLHDLTSSPMNNINSIANIANVKPGSMPSMPNVADLSAMMTNVIGTMSAGTMGRNVTSIAFSPDGRVMATGGVETKSNFDLTSMMNAAMAQGQNRKKQKKNQQVTDPAEMMKNLKVDAVGQILLWDVASGRQIGAIKGHGKGVSQVAFSRDGKTLASASTDNTIKTWDIATGRELHTFIGHTAAIDSIDFSPDGRLLASAAEDGATFLWDANTGERLLTLISLDDGGEWMVVTPQGLFDGTPVSWNQILWRYNQDTFNVAPIEWFFNEFYYPGLLSDIYFGKRPHVAQDVSKKDRRQPVVKLSISGEPAVATEVTSRTVKVRLEVTDAPADKDNSQGSGARDLRLFRNGSLVKVWHGDVLNGKSSVTLEQEITAIAGENRLVAYAFNRDNVKSKDAPLIFNGADNLKRKGVAYVLAIGVNEYDNAQYNLKYAVADAQSFGEEVRSRQTQLAAFERVEVVPLLNGDATKSNILTALRRLAGNPGPPSLKAGPLDALRRVEPEDTVIVYFAGHGTAQQQRFYLIPHDLGYAGDRTKLDEKGLKTILEHGISDLELEDAVEGVDAGHFLMVIDACNSGQALEAEEKRRGPMNSKGLAQLAYEKGIYILTAAQSFQAALEAAQLGHGLLTYALVEEGLKTAKADSEPRDGVVNAREWLDYATDRVPQMQEEKMQQGRGIGLEIAFTEGEQKTEPEKRSVQRPRVFYRRELEANPLVMAKP
jgi:WD40 repeat protein/uncharacterized caspase-like protein